MENFFKDTHREKAIQEFTKSINMDIWVVGTLNQRFSNNETKFSKKIYS